MKKGKDLETIWAIKITGSKKRLIKEISGALLLLLALAMFIALFAGIRAGVCYMEKQEVTMKCVLNGYRG